jgi:hypothetical protein
MAGAVHVKRNETSSITVCSRSSVHDLARGREPMIVDFVQSQILPREDDEVLTYGFHKNACLEIRTSVHTYTCMYIFRNMCISELSQPWKGVGTSRDGEFYRAPPRCEGHSPDWRISRGTRPLAPGP